MVYFFHIAIGLLILLLQTTLLPNVDLFNNCYDLLIVQIVFLGLYRPVRESVIIIGLLGIAVDSLTGGPYGVYLTTYIWLFLSVRWALVYLRLSDTIILPFVVAYGVLLENLLHFIGAISMNPSSATIAQMSVRPIVMELLWAIFTGPILLGLLSLLHHKSKNAIRRVIMARDNG
jgi:rod shape-determining protein MreD